MVSVHRARDGRGRDDRRAGGDPQRSQRRPLSGIEIDRIPVTPDDIARAVAAR